MQHYYVETINNCGASLLEIIDEILDFAIIESKKVELDLNPFALSDLLENLNALMSTKAASKDLVFEYQLSKDIPDIIIGDKGRLRQILTNLIDNAIKFTHTGKVSLGITVDSQGNKQLTLHFSITDSGIGIPKNKQATIFERFEQADASMSRRYGGTGLGLAICRHLVELMQGKIYVQSEPGKGSTFHFSARFGLPENPQNDDLLKAHSNKHEPEQLNKLDLEKNILLVEDNLINQRVASRILEKLGQKVSIASNGEQALQLLSEQPFDLVLMDIQMPGMDGYDTTRAIRSGNSRTIDRQIPIIAMTAHSLEQDRQSCLESGMNDFLSKPVNPKDLRESLLQWLKD